MRKMAEQPERGPKPFKGTIDNWYEIHIGDWYCIAGVPQGHPEFVNWFRSSRVLKKTGDMIETLNSIYKLGKKRDD